MMMNKNCMCRALIEKAEKELCGFLTEKRMAHVLSVRETATLLCDFFASFGAELSRETVELSALLHDITKCMNQKELCERLGIHLSDDDKASPETVHAVTGAYFAKQRYGVSDEIFSAILKHTVGSEEMSLTDKIIFVSDYCEEKRTHTECKASRKELLGMIEYAQRLKTDEGLAYAKKKLDYICADILAKTVKYLQGENLPVHRKTVSSFMALAHLYKDDEDFRELFERHGEVIKKYC